MKYIYSIITLVLLVISAISINRCQTIKEDLAKSEQNLKASQDTLHTYKLKNGELLTSISSYILDKSELESQLGLSKAEIKELEKKIGKLASVNNIKTEVQYEQIIVRDTVKIAEDNSLQFDINHNNEWIDIHGHGRIKDNIATTEIEHITVPVPLTVGLSDDYNIWVKSENPYLKVTDIKGAIVDGSRFYQKPKKWGLGVQAGIGAQYDLVKKNIGVGPYIGVGVSYNIIRF